MTLHCDHDAGQCVDYQDPEHKADIDRISDEIDRRSIFDELWSDTDDTRRLTMTGPELMAAASLREEPNDLVDHPPHYTAHPSGVECIEITEHMSFLRGNAVKYLWRAGEKGPAVEDLRKARWYIDREIEKVLREESRA